MALLFLTIKEKILTHFLLNKSGGFYEAMLNTENVNMQSKTV